MNFEVNFVGMPIELFELSGQQLSGDKMLLFLCRLNLTIRQNSNNNNNLTRCNTYCLNRKKKQEQTVLMILTQQKDLRQRTCNKCYKINPQWQERLKKTGKILKNIPKASNIKAVRLTVSEQLNRFLYASLILTLRSYCFAAQLWTTV